MTTELPTGPYPYAGVPWFNTPFGRDGLVAALECLWLRPGLARGVLAYLASSQATEVIPEQDAEPGKILHELCSGEMATLKEMPYGRYYGSVDATPLFVLLAGAYFERTADRAFVETLWPHVEAALTWIERCGDRDGDGFVEYGRHARRRAAPPGLAGLRRRGLPRRWSAGARADCRCARCRATFMPRGGPGRRWPNCSAMLLAPPNWRGGPRRCGSASRKRSGVKSYRLTRLALDGDKQPCRVAQFGGGAGAC